MSVQMLLEEANAKYTMLSAAKHWEPKGKQDIDAAPVGLYTKAELNSLVQKQVSATVKQFQSKISNKNNDSTKENNPNNKCHTGDKKTPQIPKWTWKAQPPDLVHPKQKLSMEKVGTAANLVVFSGFLLALLTTRTCLHFHLEALLSLHQPLLPLP